MTLGAVPGAQCEWFRPENEDGVDETGKRGSHVKTFLTIMVISLWITSVNAQGFYPFKTGDLWQYRELYDTSIITTLALNDTTMPNGFTYIHLKSSYIFGDEYFRQSDSRVYSYLAYYQTEELSYDFSKTTSDTVAVHYYPTDTTIVTVLYDDTVNAFGSLRRGWGFFESSNRSSIYELREVTDSIGLTYFQIEPGLSFVIQGARLDGIQYGIISGVESRSPAIPATLRLFQNFPNPFNPLTTIHFELPQAVHVHLELFNVLGQPVLEMLDEKRPAGVYEVPVRADGLSSGVYFYRLTAGNVIQTKKMVLMK